MVIRSIQAGDELQLIDLGHEMWSESEMFMKHPISIGKLMNISKNLFTSPYIEGFVYQNDKGIQGMWIGRLDALWYSDDLFVSDIAFYVSKKYRGTSAAIRLLTAASSWAKSMGATEISVGLSSGIDTEKTVCFFKKMGFYTKAVQMTKEI